jgi:alpha-beta hydrolase superfamily lysophospholipase
VTASSWEIPPALGPRGTLVVIAGRGEHPGVYERFGARLASDAYRVRAVGDPTADPDGVEQQVRAVLAADDTVAPVVLVGSDAGALFAAGLLAQGRVEADALILAGLPVAPGTDSNTAPSVSNWDDELVERTSCPTHQGKLRADGNVRHGAIGEALPDEWFKTADLAAVGVPILGLHGAADTISPLQDAKAQYATAPDARLVSIVGGKHDALNDATHRTAAATIVLFLEAHKAGLPEIAHPEDLA